RRPRNRQLRPGSQGPSLASRPRDRASVPRLPARRHRQGHALVLGGACPLGFAAQPARPCLAGARSPGARRHRGPGQRDRGHAGRADPRQAAGADRRRACPRGLQPEALRKPAPVTGGRMTQAVEPVRALCEALVRRRSVTPDDAGCQQLIVERLAPLGFVGAPERHGEVTNLWLVRDGGRPGPTLVFAGHTDVVPTGPPSESASDPFEPVERDGNLHGRGTADMKSSIAAFVVAVERFLAGAGRDGFAGRIALLITSDEEGPAVDGTVRVVEALEARGERLDYCIVGEP